MRYSFLAFTLTTLLFSFSQGAVIQQVKGRSAIVELEGMVVSLDDELYAKNESGQNKALLKVTKIKGGRALVRILKGQPRVGYEVASKDSTLGELGDARTQSPLADVKFGLLLGYASDTMKVKNNLIDANTTGSSFSIGGMADFNVAEKFQIRPYLILKPWNTKETKGSAEREVKVSYLNIGGVGKYQIFGKKAETLGWIGGGLGVLIPSSKESNIIDKDSIGATGEIQVAFGVDITAGKKIIIPATLFYSHLLFGGSSEASGNSMGLNSGILFSF